MPEERYVKLKHNETGVEAWYDTTTNSFVRNPDLPIPYSPFKDYATSPLFTKDNIQNPVLRGAANLIPSLLMNVGKAGADIIESPKTFGQIPTIAQYLATPDYSNPLGKLHSVGSAVGEELIAPYRAENIGQTLTEDPGKPIVDLAQLGLLATTPGELARRTLSGVKTTGNIVKTLAKAPFSPSGALDALKLKTLEHFTKGVESVKPFHLETLSDIPSSTLDAYKYGRERGFNPTVSQITENVRPAQYEVGSEQLSGRLREQDVALGNVIRDFATKEGLDVFSDPSNVAAGYRRTALKEVKAWKNSLDTRTSTFLTSLHLNPTETNLFDPNLTKVVKGFAKEGKLGVISELDNLRKETKAFNKATGLPPTKTLIYSRDLVSKSAPAPVIETDVDMTRIHKVALASKERFKEFLTVPGITKDDGRQLLVHNMIRAGLTEEGEFSADRVIKFLAEHGAKFKLVGDSRWRASLQNFAHVLKQKSQYGNISSMALRMANQAGAGEVNVTAALVPLAFGGNPLAGRASFGAVQYLRAKLAGPTLGKLLINPDANFLMTKLAQTPATSPAAKGTMLKFLKLANELGVAGKVQLSDEDEIALEQFLELSKKKD